MWGIQKLLDGCDGVFQAGAVSGSICRTGGAKGAELPVREIATKDRESASGKGLGECSEQRGLCVATSAVGKDQAVAVRVLGQMQKSADGRVGATVHKFANGECGQEMILLVTAGFVAARSLSGSANVLPTGRSYTAENPR